MIKRLVLVSLSAMAFFGAYWVSLNEQLASSHRTSFTALLVLVGALIVYKMLLSFRIVKRAVSATAIISSLLIISGAINILALVGPFYMLQIYDRVLPAKSIETLTVISVIAAGLFVASGILDSIRARILNRVGSIFVENYSTEVYYAIINEEDGHQGVRDLDTLRSFFSSTGPIAAFDLPWVPIYLFVVWSFHPTLGWAVLCGILALMVLTVLTEISTKKKIVALNMVYGDRNTIVEAARRNREVLRAMGLGRMFLSRWDGANDKVLRLQERLADLTGFFGNTSKTFRVILQSGMLGLGAYLVVNQQATGGVIIAASILSARALAPIDMAIANWKGFSEVRKAFGRLTRIVQIEGDSIIELPAPSSVLRVDNVSVPAPVSGNPLVEKVDFTLRAGQAMALLGHSGSGKSTVVRAIVGAWPISKGRIKLDGAPLDQWGHHLSKHIGYLPQDVELFPGTIAENIARFDPMAKDSEIINAAKEAGAHEMILSLPMGYMTRVEENGRTLSGGQRQKIGLARALFGKPFLMVLDEPNSSLDLLGESQLAQAIINARRRGGIVIVVTHRQSVLAVCDYIGVMDDGRMVQADWKDKIMRRPEEKRDAFTARNMA